MSTRATYEFADSYGDKSVVYIHHDGYPEGAAVYFRRFLDFPEVEVNGGEAGRMAARFIAANYNEGRTSIFPTVWEHGDTEYHYIVTWDRDCRKWMVRPHKVDHRATSSGATVRDWKPIGGNEALAEFVARHS